MFTSLLVIIFKIDFSYNHAKNYNVINTIYIGFVTIVVSHNVYFHFKLLF